MPTLEDTVKLQQQLMRHRYGPKQMPDLSMSHYRLNTKDAESFCTHPPTYQKNFQTFEWLRGKKLPPVKKLSVPKSFRLNHYWAGTAIQTEPSLSTDITPVSGELGNSRTLAISTDPPGEINCPSLSEIGQHIWSPSQVQVTIRTHWGSSSRAFHIPQHPEPETRVLPLSRYRPPPAKGISVDHVFQIISVLTPTICQNGRLSGTSSTTSPRDSGSLCHLNGKAVRHQMTPAACQIPILYVDGIKARRSDITKQALRQT
ncbi:unnamed protein product, partial [Allacma fusca]